MIAIAFFRRRYSRFIIAVALFLMAGGLAVAYFEVIVIPRRYYDTINDPGFPHPNRDRVLLYAGPWGDSCRIEFTNGNATNVQHYGK